MHFKFSSALILRMPAKSVDHYGAKLEVLLADSYFRSAVWLASPVFYRQLEKAGFDLSQLSQRALVTLQKYANRICFRPVPFGLFASVSLARWGKDLVVGQEGLLSPQVFPSQEWLVSYRKTQHTNDVDEAFIVNPTLYRLLNEFRFIRTDVVEHSRSYLLQSVAYTPLLKALLVKAALVTPRVKMVEKIVEIAQCSPAEANAYFDFLTDAQLLLSPDHLTIHARGVPLSIPYENLKWKIPSPEGPERSSVSGEASIDRLPFVGKALRDLSGEPAGELLPFNVILKRDAGGETLPVNWQKKIGDALSAIETLVPEQRNTAMEAFVEAFRQQFGDEQVPLLKALDPEIGIAYGPPVETSDNNFLDTVHIQGAVPAVTGVPWSKAHAFLMQRWQDGIRKGASVITIEHTDLNGLVPGEQALRVMGMSVLFRYTGTQLWIENAGGVNPVALAGRFTVADDDILTATRNMAKEIETMYPDIIFAEILHLSDPHIDNVNVRETIWHYELPVTANSQLPASRQLHLSDLVLRLYGKHVILWSQTHQKMVVPRLSTAYNHSLNKLPLFRFLADIPYQFARSSYQFDLRDLFPGLLHYPRVEFMKTILQPAWWLLKETQIAMLIRDGTSLKAVTTLLDDIGVPNEFSIGDGDQQVLIFRKRDEDVRLFLSMLGKQSEIWIREIPGGTTLAPGQRVSTMQFPIRQYNAFILPSDPDLFPPVGKLWSSVALPQRFVPGAEWLYLKIYMPGSIANKILLRAIPILHGKYERGKIGKWFFIRYHDNGPHIRLRILLDPLLINEVLQRFKALLENIVRQHVIREYQLDTYTREMTRYAIWGYDRVESFFWRSSELVAQFIKHQRSADTLTAYHFALITTELLAFKFITDRTDLISFYEDSYLMFLPEFEGMDIIGDLSKKYRQVRQVIEANMTRDHLLRYQGFKTVLRHFEESAAGFPMADPEARFQFLRSLIHMHLNRIFTDHSRKQEMMTYYMLFKHSRSVLARSR